ncbi:hypothetical protein HOY80DRAFT_1133195 [Tuber brumale]|nr:hypothetical protein HOY80DRAFT_1133195 [Tuber brumale]
MVNSIIYTIGGAAIYWTSESAASSIISGNNNSVYILKTANSFLRALDLSKPVDFEAEFSDTSEMESIYRGGAFQNITREWPDPMKYYMYDLSQPKGSGTWNSILISEDKGSDTLTGSPSHGEYAYSTEARKGFYLGGSMARYGLKNKDESNATTEATDYAYHVDSMVVFDSATSVWKNETIIQELFNLRNGVMVYVAGVGEKGILVRMGGLRKEEFVGVSLILCHIFRSGAVGFDTVHVYDIAARVWYRQPTTSQTKILPESRFGGFCTGAAAAPDKTSFTVYIYEGYGDSGYDDSYVQGTWALTMPYFQWLPVGSAGAPKGGRSQTTCEAVGGVLAMVRGHGKMMNRGDTNGGTYFYDMTNLTWSLKYKPSEYLVPKTIYDVIGGNGRGGATIASPADDENFAGGLGKLSAAAANRTNGSGSTISTGAIVGGVIAGVALLAAGIWALLRLRRRSADTAGEGEIVGEPQEDSLMGMGENPAAPNHGHNSHWSHEAYSGPLPELDGTRV